jgi:hypothetical protein
LALVPDEGHFAKEVSILCTGSQTGSCTWATPIRRDRPTSVSSSEIDPGDVPIAGDFNGDGFDTVSIYRPSNRTFYIINDLGEDGGSLGAADFSFVFGDPGDEPFAGDLNGDGVDEVGLHRDTTGLVYHRNTLTTGAADVSFIWGDPADIVFAGDWDGDMTDTVGLLRSSNSTFYWRNTNTQGVADGSAVVPGGSTNTPVVGRFGS